MTRQASRPRALAVWALRLAGALACSWLFVALACNRSSPTEPDQRPVWLSALIGQMQNEPVTSPPSSIVRYRYRGETVFFRPARCCDIPSVLYDAQGTVVCNPDGGLAGGVDSHCADFFAARSDPTLIWQDTRR